jgi:hypothetical protein
VEERSLRAKPILLLLAVPVIALAVGFWPSGDLAITQECEPQDVLASFKAALQGDRFWSRQLQHLDKEVEWIHWLFEMRASSARGKNGAVEELYTKYPKLRPSGAEEEADALRRRADAIDQIALEEKEKRVFGKRLAELENCRPMLVSRSHERR